MIISDMDNIAGMSTSPSRQTILDELRKQTEALVEFRRQLRTNVHPSMSALTQNEVRPRFVAHA